MCNLSTLTREAVAAVALETGATVGVWGGGFATGIPIACVISARVWGVGWNEMGHG